MQPHDSNDQCPEAGDSDGRRDAEQSPVQDATGMALPQVFDVAYGPVRVKMVDGVIRTVSSDIPDTPSWFPAMAAVEDFVARNRTVCLSASILGKGGLAA